MAVNDLFQQPLALIQNTLKGFLLDVADAEKQLLRDMPSLDQDLKPVLLDRSKPPKPTTDPKAAVTTAIASKFNYLLEHLLPYLRDQLSHAFVKQTVVDTFGLDSAVAQLLLERSVLKESVLKSPADSQQPSSPIFWRCKRLV